MLEGRDKDKLTPLMRACKEKNSAQVATLLATSEIDLDLTDLTVNHKLAIQLAAPISGDPCEVSEEVRAIVQCFWALSDEYLNRGARKTLHYLFLYAAWIGDEAGVERCLRLEVDPNVQHLECGALWEAASNGYEPIVARLLAHPGINVNLPNYRGDTAIITALEWGYLEIAYRLLARPDCSLGPGSYFFGTPLTAAVHFGHQEFARAVMAQWERCDIHYTALAVTLCIRKGAEWDWLLLALLDRGASVSEGEDLLHESAAAGPGWAHQETQEAPLGCGDWNMRTFQSPWSEAVAYDNHYAMQLLRDRGADPASVTRWSPMRAAWMSAVISARQAPHV